MWHIIALCWMVVIFPGWSMQAERVRVVELTSSWVLRNLSSSAQITVPKIPSGIFTAVKAIYGDVLQGDNDETLQWIANETWIYCTTFDDDENGRINQVNLTLHGIDTIASIMLNGNLIGHTENMFVRYSFDVKNLLRSTQNKLEIILLPPVEQAKIRAEILEQQGIIAPPDCPNTRGYVECHRNLMRKMQMSFGGQWSPTVLSSGIWKPIALEYYEVALLQDVDVAITRNTTHWTMDCRVFLSSLGQEKYYVELSIFASELFDSPFVLDRQEMTSQMTSLSFQLHIPKDRVQLWWPNGYGTPKLYPILFSLKSFSSVDGPRLSSRTTSEKLLKIGFRIIELIEEREGNGRTFYFRVNNHPIFAKGANYLPANSLPELSADIETMEHLLRSAKEANMNMIRIWGGGIYESDTFYSLADQYGLLIWQDMTFTAATYPIVEQFVLSLREETSQNAKRIAYHPSLAVIVTNNEIELYLVKNRSDFTSDARRLEEEYKMLFMGILYPELNIISRNEFSPRPGPIISTPSLGVIESGNQISTDPNDINYGDVHFWEEGFGPDIYPNARFISEFGYPSLPVLSSWKRALGDSKLPLGDLMRARQHDPRGFIPMLRMIAYQLLISLQNWEEQIEDFIYFSQVTQAMTAKLAFDVFRSRRVDNQTMGALIWSLNDVWAAPTCSLIDFYGNYKIVYYWAKDMLASPSVIAIYDEKNDQLNLTLTREDYSANSDRQMYNIIVDTYIWSEFFSKKTIARAVALDSNEIVHVRPILFKTVLFETYTKAETFLEIYLEDNNNQIVSRTFLYPVTFKNIVGIRDPELKLEVIEGDCKSSTFINSFSLRITIKYPALLIYLELDHPDYLAEDHKFSMNGFTQTEPVKIIHLEFKNTKKCLTIQPDHIKVKTMNQYIK